MGFALVVDQPHPPSRTPGSLLVVAPAALLQPRIPHPAGRLLYELLTGHPARKPGALVFPIDLTEDLWAWDGSTWPAHGVDLAAAVEAVALQHRRGKVNGLRFDDLTAAELHALSQASMTVRRGELRRRLCDRIDPSDLDWLPTPAVPNAAIRSP